MLTVDELKQKLRYALKGWRPKMEQAGITTIYALLSSYALFPILIAYQQGQFQEMAGVMALGVLLSNLGINVASTGLTHQLEKWRAEIESEEALAKHIQTLPTDSRLHAELDTLLEKLDALELARAALPETDKAWFTQMVHEELQRWGHFKKNEAKIEGDWNVVVQGEHHHVQVTLEKHEHHHTAPAKTDEASLAREAARIRYFNALRRYCSFLPLAAISADESSDEDVTLDDVYIELNTTLEVPLSEAEQAELRKKRGPVSPKDVTHTVTAMEAALMTKRLVLLGDPGSGKSAFVSRWLAQLADAHLGKRPLPDWATPQTLPLLIILRDLIAQLDKIAVAALPDDRRRETLATVAREQLLKDLARFDAADFAEGLVAALHSGDCLLALDGLDEVPQHLRPLAKEAVQALLTTYPLRRLIITCRVRSYVDDAQLEHFEHYILAGFNPEQIRSFAQAWYTTQRKLNRLTDEQAQTKANNLATAAVDPNLIELASNPMLLTTLASIHQREATLPRERVRLYDAAVRNLLFRWQRSKLAMSDALARFVDSNEIRDAMELLAFHAHSAGQKDKEAADLSRGQAIELLEKVLPDLDTVNEFLHYVDHRAGLLIGMGSEPHRPERYRFPHRTFQEYLAGCYLVRQPHPHRHCYPLAAQGDYWSLAVQLGAEELYFTRRLPSTVLELAYGLGRHEPTTEQNRRSLLWSANIATLLGPAKVAEDQEGSEDYLKRIIPHLISLLTADTSTTSGQGLTALERAEAGRDLGKLGDPRPEVMTVDGMRFCYVPAGSFLMGSAEGDSQAYEDEMPQHELNLPDYRLAEYPVSNAQFAEFVAAGGYGSADYWKEAKAAGFWKEGAFQGRWDNAPRVRPVEYGEPFNLPNQPVVGISWYEALAFARWLTDRWHARSWLPTDWQITLPSEAEWEKAAKGGACLPRAVMARPISQLDTFVQTELIDRASHPWPYPWGDDFNSNMANTSETGLHSPSALGCFPFGQSVYGVQDLSGNVWEWTRSLWGKGSEGNYGYPYTVDQEERENLNAPPDITRVLRGGSFSDVSRGARCAYRSGYNPASWFGCFGFRVVAAPFLSRL